MIYFKKVCCTRKKIIPLRGGKCFPEHVKAQGYGNAHRTDNKNTYGFLYGCLRYALQGNEVMKVRNSYSGAFKARIVRAWINGDKNLLELAEEYELHPNQIKNWKSSLLKQAEKVLEDKRRKLLAS